MVNWLNNAIFYEIYPQSFKDTNAEYMAPFRYINAATIRNLHVTGTIDGGQHPAGVAGRGFVKSENLIENCRVSATIYSSTVNPHVGGFIGHNGSAATTLIAPMSDMVRPCRVVRGAPR